MSYEYVLPPFKHQATGVQLLRGRTFYGFFDEPGCGKSKIIVDGCNLLYNDGAICAVVVVCPNTVKSTWANPEWGQIAKNTPPGFPFHAFQLESGKKLPKISHLKKGESLVWLVVNYEALRTLRVEQFLKNFLLNFAPSVLVLDESTKIKSNKALQTKAAYRLKDAASRRYILSGTPMAKNPLDLYSQMNFLDRSILRTPSYVAFRNRYAKMGGYMVGGKPVQIVGWQNLDELREIISHHSRVIYKQDALPELPVKTYNRLEIPLSPEQVLAYKQMKENAVATMQGHIGLASARIALTKILRLTQITSGHLPLMSSTTGDSRVHCFNTNPKHEALIEMLEDTQHMVVFAMFIPEITSLSERLTKAGISHGLIYGETKLSERTLIQERYQRGEIRVVVCQVVTGGIGITLVRGSTAVYLTNAYSHEARIQSEDRLHRPGQAGLDDKVQYFDFCSTCEGDETVDHSVLAALSKKQNLSDAIIGRLMEEVL